MKQIKWFEECTEIDINVIDKLNTKSDAITFVNWTFRPIEEKYPVLKNRRDER